METKAAPNPGANTTTVSTEKKKVLIISGTYLRSNAISSTKPRKIAKYLNACGRYDVSVMTTYKRSEMTAKASKNIVDLPVAEKDGYVCDFTLIPQSDSLAAYRVLRKPFRVIERVLRKVLKFKRTRNIKHALMLLDDMSFYRRSKRAIREKRLWETDIIFSTYWPYACHYIARYIKKKNPAVFWVADFDDPAYREGLTARLLGAYARGYAKKICSTADAITSVSQGFLDIIDLPKNIPTAVISNGFDPDDAPAAVDGKSDKLVLAYTGTMYKDMQDLTAVFRAIRELIDEGKIDEDKIRLEYAGAHAGVLAAQARGCGLQDILHSHGFVSRDKALEIQKNGSMLLVASWNKEGHKGVLTGKLFEYMMMNKPILSTVAGDVPNSEFKEVLDRCSLGFCYEEACHERDYAQLKEYIHKQYRYFTEHGSALFEPNTEEIDKYSYPSIAQELERLFCG